MIEIAALFLFPSEPNKYISIKCEKRNNFYCCSLIAILMTDGTCDWYKEDDYNYQKCSSGDSCYDADVDKCDAFADCANDDEDDMADEPKEECPTDDDGSSFCEYTNFHFFSTRYSE